MQTTKHDQDSLEVVADASEQDDKRLFQMQLEYFEAKSHSSASRLTRLEDLMSRKNVKGWKPAKIAKMIRRLEAAKKTSESSSSAIENLTDKLSSQ